MSPMPIRSGKASRPDGVEGTSFLEVSDRVESVDFVVSLVSSFGLERAESSSAITRFSFSSSGSGLTTACFAVSSALGCPPKWKTLSLFLVAVETGIGGLSCRGFE